MTRLLARLAERTLWWYFRAALRGFFREIEVQGAGQVPRTGAVLLLPNHLNAFVDPLLIRLALGREITITAKAPLAARPLLAPLMRLARVIPFHRPEDRGGAAVPRRLTEAGLAACRERLEIGEALCVFPEGVSHEDPRMRPFRSGPARIALDFIAANRGRALPIVPVGLNFEAKEHFRSRVWIRFGPPLDTGAWADGRSAAMPRELMADLRAWVARLIVELPTRRQVLVLRWAARLVASEGRERRPFVGPEVPFPRIITALAALRATLCDDAGVLPARRTLYRRLRSLRGRLSRQGLRPEDAFLCRDPLSIARGGLVALVVLGLGAPIAAWGTLMNAIPAGIVAWLTHRRSHLPDLWASNAVFLGLLCFPTAYLIQVIAASVVLPGPWLAGYALSLPTTGYAALLYADRLRAYAHDTRALWRLRDHSLHERLRAETEAMRQELSRMGTRGPLGEAT